MPNSPKIRYTGRNNSLGNLIAVAAGMLLVGFAAGYFARPLLDPAPPEEPVAQAPAPAEPVAPAGADAQQVMVDLVAQTRHFKGDPNAPVTLLEFSDFQ